jgi:hypothetical protein
MRSGTGSGRVGRSTPATGLSIRSAVHPRAEARIREASPADERTAASRTRGTGTAEPGNDGPTATEQARFRHWHWAAPRFSVHFLCECS